MTAMFESWRRQNYYRNPSIWIDVHNWKWFRSSFHTCNLRHFIGSYMPALSSRYSIRSLCRWSPVTQRAKFSCPPFREDRDCARRSQSPLLAALPAIVLLARSLHCTSNLCTIPVLQVAIFLETLSFPPCNPPKGRQRMKRHDFLEVRLSQALAGRTNRNALGTFAFRYIWSAMNAH